MESADNLLTSKEIPPSQEEGRKKELMSVPVAVQAGFERMALIKEPIPVLEDHKLKSVEGEGEISKEVKQTREEIENKMEPESNPEHTTFIVQKGVSFCCTCVSVCLAQTVTACQLARQLWLGWNVACILQRSIEFIAVCSNSHSHNGHLFSSCLGEYDKHWDIEWLFIWRDRNGWIATFFVSFSIFRKIVRVWLTHVVLSHMKSVFVLLTQAVIFSPNLLILIHA